MWRHAIAGLLVVGTVGCGGDEAVTAATVAMDFSADPAVDFYAAPFPSEHHRGDDGRVGIGGFPNPHDTLIVNQVRSLLQSVDGFATTAGIFVRVSAPLDAGSLPTLHETVTLAASVYLLDLEDNTRHPVTVRFHADAGPHGGPNLLSVLPLQGVPLRPRAAYALVVTDGVRDATGAPLSRAPSLQRLLDGEVPEGLTEEARVAYQSAVISLQDFGLSERAVGLSVFRTWDPRRRLTRLIDAAKKEPVPSLEAPLALQETFDDYCVYEGVLQDIPLYQEGEAPYLETGGDIAFEADGTPVRSGSARARIVVTVPRAEMPTAGWPLATMIRTGGGGDRPLVDRGQRAEPGGEAITTGTGPALHFARAGFAGISIDGPHGGLRNVTGGDEQFLVFNIQNPAALRGNLWQSALEIALVPSIARTLAIDVSGCPGAVATFDEVTFSEGPMALMGHSMGATIAPLVSAGGSAFSAYVLSGAGGSWIENVVHKQSPIPTRPLAELLLAYTSLDRELHEHDPFLSMLQWVGEPVDPPVYASQMSGARVLMLQGIVDTYILPPIANATSLSLKLPLGGSALDEQHPDLTAFRPLRDVLVYGADREDELPVKGNVGGLTRVVVQHAEGPVEDGHEVVFQLEGPKHQYRCFLESLRTDAVPRVPVATVSSDAPCGP